MEMQLSWGEFDILKIDNNFLFLKNCHNNLKHKKNKGL